MIKLLKLVSILGGLMILSLIATQLSLFLINLINYNISRCGPSLAPLVGPAEFFNCPLVLKGPLLLIVGLPLLVIWFLIIKKFLGRFIK